MPYCGLTKAANKLPENCRKAFKDAFNATNMTDLYDGDLKTYFQVIKLILERNRDRLKSLEIQIDKLNETMNRYR